MILIEREAAWTMVLSRPRRFGLGWKPVAIGEYESMADCLLLLAGSYAQAVRGSRGHRVPRKVRRKRAKAVVQRLMH